MEQYLIQFAATEASSDDGILAALGIDVQMLVLQAIAFLILVWLLNKFIYPIFIKIVDERQAGLEESVKAADEAKQKAEDAEKEVEKLMEQARKDAKDIVATAKDEATAAIAAAESKANDKASKIVESAHEQIDKDVLAAKKTLHNETIDLVASATETILKQKVDSKADHALLTSAVKEAK